MNVGTLLTALTGFGSIKANEQWHLLSSSSNCAHVLLVRFIDGREKAVDFMQIERGKFERALLDGLLVVGKFQPSLPPWLSRLEGLDMKVIEAKRVNRKRTNLSRANERLAAIAPLVLKAEQIFSSNDPRAAIARIQRELMPDVHPARLTVWFVSYIVFGCNVTALYPAYIQIGRWDRSCGIAYSRRTGPSGTKGRTAGCIVDEAMRKKILRGYIKYTGRCDTQRTIYVEVLLKEFGCSVKGQGASRRIIHPRNEPFPSHRQFYYWVDKEFGVKERAEAVYGATRLRNRVLPSIGKFSESVANIYERCEADGKWIVDSPTSLDGQPSANSLCSVRIRDTASGMLVGIGFALDGEPTSAYRAALFCAAIKKSEFGRLFGVTILDDNWPCIGLPASFTSDRGAGTTPALFRDQPPPINIVLMTPSFAPRSKSGIESSHPRQHGTDGVPLSFESSLNIVGLVKEEILRTVAHNWKSDASDLMTPEMIGEGVTPCPGGIFSWLDSRARTSGRMMAFEDAVRTFLTPVTFIATVNEIMLGVRRFGSDGLRQSRVYEKLKRGQPSIQVNGYALDLCVRFAWVEVDGQLIEVSALLPIRDDHNQLDVPLAYLHAEEKTLAGLESERRKLAEAAEMERLESGVADIGKSANSSVARQKKRTKSKDSTAVGKKDRQILSNKGKS